MGEEWGEGDIFWKSGRGGVVRGADDAASGGRGEGSNENQCVLAWRGGKRRGTFVTGSRGVLRVCWGGTGYLGRDGSTTGAALELPGRGRRSSAGGGWVIHDPSYHMSVSSVYCFISQERVPRVVVLLRRHCFFWQVEP